MFSAPRRARCERRRRARAAATAGARRAAPRHLGHRRDAGRLVVFTLLGRTRDDEPRATSPSRRSSAASPSSSAAAGGGVRAPAAGPSRACAAARRGGRPVTRRGERRASPRREVRKSAAVASPHAAVCESLRRMQTRLRRGERAPPARRDAHRAVLGVGVASQAQRPSVCRTLGSSSTARSADLLAFMHADFPPKDAMLAPRARAPCLSAEGRASVRSAATSLDEMMAVAATRAPRRLLRLSKTPRNDDDEELLRCDAIRTQRRAPTTVAGMASWRTMPTTRTSVRPQRGGRWRANDARLSMTTTNDPSTVERWPLPSGRVVLVRNTARAVILNWVQTA